MTKPQQTYILSDAECVIKAIPDYPGTFNEFMRNNPSLKASDYEKAVEQAKKTAVKFADQKSTGVILLLQNGLTEHKPDTIYTVEGYGVGEIDMLQTRHGVEWYDLPGQKEGRERDGIYRTIKLATLVKRTEPVVEPLCFEKLSELTLLVADSFGKYGDEQVMISGNQSYTGNQIRDEIFSGTKFGLDIVCNFVSLAIDMVKRGKENINPPKQ